MEWVLEGKIIPSTCFNSVLCFASNRSYLVSHRILSRKEGGADSWRNEGECLEKFHEDTSRLMRILGKFWLATKGLTMAKIG